MKSRGTRRIFRWIAAAVFASAVAAGIAISAGRGKESPLPRPEACPVVSNVLAAVAKTFAPDGDSIRLDVRKTTVADFRRRLSGVSPAATLWTPGEGDWLIVGASGGSSNTLERTLEAFADAETAFSFSEVFANCVGTVAEILPAFDRLDPADGVVTELFVPNGVPDFEWLTDGDIDADIAARTRQAMRSAQNLRRKVLEGNILSRRGEAEAAVKKWAEVFRLQPNDTLLQERMHHLRKNAEVFFRIGKYGMAGKCYETLILIDGGDRIALENLRTCFERLGRKDLARAIAERLRSPQR